MAASIRPLPRILPISEPAVVDDVFVMELVRVERLGPCLRLSFAIEQPVPGTDPPVVELAIKAKIIIPITSVGAVSTKLVAGEEIELSPDIIAMRPHKVS